MSNPDPLHTHYWKEVEDTLPDGTKVVRAVLDDPECARADWARSARIAYEAWLEEELARVREPSR